MRCGTSVLPRTNPVDYWKEATASFGSSKVVKRFSNPTIFKVCTVNLEGLSKRMAPPPCFAAVRWRTSMPMPLESMVGTSSRSKIIRFCPCPSSSLRAALKRSSGGPMAKRPFNLMSFTPSTVLVSISKCAPPGKTAERQSPSLTPQKRFATVRAQVS